jgi:hypothetical protein
MHAGEPAKAAKWLRLALAAFATAIGAAMTFNALLDPFHLIRHSGIYVVTRDFQHTMNAGVIRTAPSFDAAVIGSSYVGNFDPAVIDPLFHVTSKVVSVFGSSQSDISETLRYLLQRRPELKLIFLEVSIWNVCQEANTSARRFPIELYRDDPRGLLKYLASAETLTLSALQLAYRIGYPFSRFSRDETQVHRWYEAVRASFGNPTHVMRVFNRDIPDQTTVKNYSAVQIEAEAQALLDCFERNVVRHALDNPATRFFVFNPPVLQWTLWVRARLGLIDVWNRAQELFAERITTVLNLRYFDFYAAAEIENDCNRFMDIAHFDPAASDQLVHWMHEGQFERTPRTNSAITSAVREAAAKRVACPPQ